MKLEQMLAREAIRYTMSVYNNTGDRGAVADTATCFAEGGILDVGTEQPAGPAAVQAYLQSVKDSGYIAGANARPTRHHLTTSRIEFTSDTTADSWTYFQLVRDGVIVQNGIYVDKWQQVGERWLISNRRVKVEYDSLATA